VPDLIRLMSALLMPCSAPFEQVADAVAEIPAYRPEHDLGGSRELLGIDGRLPGPGV